MDIEVVGEIGDVETIAAGSGIREVGRLRKTYGPGRWRKLKGTADVRLAFNSGEVQGVCNALESFRSTWRNELDSGNLIIVLQTIAKRHPELPNVPLAIDYAKTDEAKRLINALVHSVGPTARPYVLPPKTPKEQVMTLRNAFMQTMKDPEFLAEATKAKLDINPLDGAELERDVREVFNLDKVLLPKAKEILK